MMSLPKRFKPMGLGAVDSTPLPIPVSPCSTMLVGNIPPMPLSEILILFEKFGSVKGLMKVENDRAVLVEYYDATVVSQMLQKSRVSTFFVGGNRATLEFARADLTRLVSGDGPGTGGIKVLSMVIKNANFPIDVEVIHSFCNKLARVVRMIVNDKQPDNSVEALVEFASSLDALHVMNSLQGANIYVGCCTLNITPSHHPSLSIKQNGSNAWDFTVEDNPGFVTPAIDGLLPPISLGMAPESLIARAKRGVPFTTSVGQPGIVLPPDLTLEGDKDLKLDKTELLPYVEEEGAVLMVYHLAPNMNCDMLFNLFCVYGNVARIKYLLSRPGSAMLQMGNKDQAKEAETNYNGVSLYGMRLEVIPSKKNAVKRPSEDIALLNDGTPSFVDYETNINNRFLTQALAEKNKILSPSSSLHFYNCPPNFTAVDVKTVLCSIGCVPPLKVTVFPSKVSNKSCMGLVEYGNVDDALKSLALSNHCQIYLQGKKSPFHLKFTFTKEK